MQPSELAQIKVFAAVAEQLSFRQAARQLNSPASVVSRTVKQLELRLGATLFNRTTRSVSLTAAGRAFAAQALPALAMLDRAIASIDSTDNDPAGELRINLALLPMLFVMVPLMDRFAESYPRVRIDFVIADEILDIVAQGCDAGIRPQPMVPADMVSIPVTGPLRMAIVGSPAYFAAHPIPQTPADLASHRCIGYRFGADRVPYRWRLHDGDRVIDVTPDAPYTVTNTDVMVRMAQAGIGLTLTPERHVQAEIAAGSLVSVLSDYWPVRPPLCLYYPAGHQLSPALRAVIEFFRYRDAAVDLRA